MIRPASLALVLLLVPGVRAADAPRPANYDEAAVGTHPLPDLLAGCPDAATWTARRRAEVLELFRANMHGRSPAAPQTREAVVTSVDSNALGGLAVRTEVTLAVFGHPLHLLVYRPRAAERPVPVFLGVNFDGNHTVDSDPGITLHPQWVWDRTSGSDRLETPAAQTRGRSIGRWGISNLLARGYAVATIPRADVEPDYPGGWKHGLRGAWLKHVGRDAFAPDDWGAIAAWAWSLSRALDYLETDPAMDARRAIVIGHSRMGKAALWAGAEDQRFALVISNNSGEGGAALARRDFGETTEVINRNFPHWFCDRFKTYSADPAGMPFDAHMLLALVAPRPLYVASAEEDRWADPRGEFLAAQAAEPVYALFGRAGLGVGAWPAVNQPVGQTIGYHVRTGKHDVLAYDWEQYLNFADRHLGSHRP